MMRILLLGALACLAVLVFVLLRNASARTAASLDVEFKLTDDQYQPLAGVPLRLVLGVADWQAPEAGLRIVTAPDGTARFTTQALVDRRWQFFNIGFTPLSMPVRTDHIAVAAELAFALPKRDGEDTIYHWLYTADIDRLPDGDCSTDDLDEVYEAAPDGRFTKLIGSNAAGPNFETQVDGWLLSSAGYKLWDFQLTPKEDAPAGQSWRLKLAIMRKPKAVLPP
jgi:hypothetical protein